jgi:hypothetical protein
VTLWLQWGSPPPDGVFTPSARLARPTIRRENGLGRGKIPRPAWSTP